MNTLFRLFAIREDDPATHTIFVRAERSAPAISYADSIEDYSRLDDLTDYLAGSRSTAERFVNEFFTAEELIGLVLVLATTSNDALIVKRAQIPVPPVAAPFDTPHGPRKGFVAPILDSIASELFFRVPMEISPFDFPVTGVVLHLPLPADADIVSSEAQAMPHHPLESCLRPHRLSHPPGLN